MKIVYSLVVVEFVLWLGCELGCFHMLGGVGAEGLNVRFAQSGVEKRGWGQEVNLGYCRLLMSKCPVPNICAICWGLSDRQCDCEESLLE